MDEKTKLLVSLAAAVAADSAFCFMNFLRKRNVVGLNAQDIEEASDIGDQIKNKAQITIKRSI
jgi:hypothetical protein